MVTTDVELELRLQLKEAGKQLSHPTASVDELLHILDQTEKLISKVDQSPNNLMLEALRPSMKAFIDERFLNHSNVDVKVAVAACLCEITRITAPDAPYNDEEMKNVFQLIVSSFENLSDKSSRSYGKRASILDTVSKVRSSCIMLDLECEELIVKMFEHFLKSVRDDHEDNIFSSMMNIMALVLEESEDISVDMLKPLLASIKNNTDGALPIARKLGEGVLKRSAAKVKPYVTKTLRILGDSLDNYSQVLASICEGTTDVEHNDETTSVQRQADESKLTTASSDNTAQVVIGNAETDATLDTTFKSVRNNERVSGNGGSADEESSKKPEEAINHVDPNPTSKFDTEDTLSEKLAKAESKPEHTSKRRGNKTDTTLKSATPSDSPCDYGENKIDKHTDFPVSVPKAIESEVADAPSESGGLPDDNYVKKDNLPKEPEAANAGAQSRSRSIPSKSRTKRAGRSKKKISSQDNAPSTAVVLAKAAEGMSDTDMKSPKRAGRSKIKSLSQDDVPSTDVVLTKAPERMSGSDMKSPKRARKKAPFAQEDKLPAAIATVEDSKPTSDSDSKHLKTSSKKMDTVDSGTKLPKRFGKKVGGVGSVAKKPKLSGKKTDAGNSEANKSKQADTKDNESDSDATPLSQFTGNKGRSRLIAKPGGCTANKEEGSDSDTQSHKQSAKKDDRSSSALVKSSSKKDGKNHKNSKIFEEKDQTKSLPEDDGMDTSPMSAVKTATQEGNLEEALVTSSKRKRASSKDKVSKAINYDDSLVGQKVKVWWPTDKTYYEGVIELFDSAKNKHTVFYLDGEREILNLRREKWEVLLDFSAHNEDKTAEGQSTGVFPETPGKKPKINSGSGALLEKSKDAPKRAGGASLSGKSKGLTSKSSASSKGKGKVGMKSTSQKNRGKAVKLANSKEAGMSMEDDEEISKIIPKKQETPKIVYKSKGRTPERSNKANTDEPVKPKSISVNVKEPVDADAAETPASPKEKAAEKTTKTGSKSGKKRRKST